MSVAHHSAIAVGIRNSLTEKIKPLQGKLFFPSGLMAADENPREIPHEKTNYRVAEKIRATLEPKTSDEIQEALHKEDESTTWFGLINDEKDDPYFRDYDRFASLMQQGSRRQRRNRYPGLAAFVGQTGAGKSTLIKMLIELQNQGSNQVETPVVGWVNHGVIPTSGDVHLYPDPHSLSEDNPLLYADCEGLEGSNTLPKAAQARTSSRSLFGDRHQNGPRGQTTYVQHTQKSPDRPLAWADTPERRSREYAVTNLYPRFFYTFSDVVVFVLKNPKITLKAVERLIDWAALSLEKTTNQPSLPHAILALNRSENSIDATRWDINKSTDWLMSEVQNGIRESVKLQEYEQFWRGRGKTIGSLKDLLLSYYSSIRVVCIPENGRPTLISNQVKSLYQEIQASCEKSRYSKRRLRMLLNSHDLQPYIQYAFDHFTQTLDIPFDFVEASFVNSPIPQDFGGDILKLAMKTLEVCAKEGFPLSAEMLFDGLAYMVASCIMLESARHKTLGIAGGTFDKYYNSICDALEDFCEKVWPCEFVGRRALGRCINTKNGHSSKGHQFRNGQIYAGEYTSTFTADQYRHTWIRNVYCILEHKLNLLHVEQNNEDCQDQAAARIHQKSTLLMFYKRFLGARFYISHSSCLCCLMGSPEHSLPCGHILCTACVKNFGRPVSKTIVEIAACPLEHEVSEWDPTYTISIKPPSAGVRILTLDGGGVRGVVELEFLSLLQQQLPEIPIRLFFDLIVGTRLRNSTGGLLALGLAAKDWDIDECEKKFYNLCTKAFQPRLGTSLPALGPIIHAFMHSLYETTSLEGALKEAYCELYNRQEYLFGGSIASHTSQRKVAVVSTFSDGQAAVLSNYNRVDGGKGKVVPQHPYCAINVIFVGPYHFQRPEKKETELEIWEAARATSAAPTFFQPFFHKASEREYKDGGLYHNNPVVIADSERKLIWPEIACRHPDVFLSIGTGYNSVGAQEPSPERPSAKSGWISYAKIQYKIAIDHIANSLDSERAWIDFLRILNPSPEDRGRFIRLNIGLNGDPPRLDDLAQMKSLQYKVRSQFRHNKIIKHVAHRLIASCFFFERSDTDVQIGFIECRLPPSKISALGRYLSQPIYESYNPHFIIGEASRQSACRQFIINAELLETMRSWNKFHLRIKLYDLDPSKPIDIRLCIESPQPPSQERASYSISGFPRVLDDNDASNGRTARERYRPPSQLSRRGAWLRAETMPLSRPPTYGISSTLQEDEAAKNPYTKTQQKPGRHQSSANFSWLPWVPFKPSDTKRLSEGSNLGLKPPPAPYEPWLQGYYGEPALQEYGMPPFPAEDSAPQYAGSPAGLFELAASGERHELPTEFSARYS
ncbi:MAG: hypothetical protein M1824_002374 [Vezdaea acicularis]|nr:MAG: hypothetical protein M1824_002374 [Vezdaea acicularis]